MITIKCYIEALCMINTNAVAEQAQTVLIFHQTICLHIISLYADHITEHILQLIFQTKYQY